MADYIRKAVEIADGWEITWEKMIPSDFTHVTMPAGVTFYLEDKARPQWAIDALAAQLVRQAESAGYMVTVYGAYVCIEGKGTEFDFKGEKGCRTINTIKAIVDSGVLDS